MAIIVEKLVVRKTLISIDQYFKGFYFEWIVTFIRCVAILLKLTPRFVCFFIEFKENFKFQSDFFFQLYQKISSDCIEISHVFNL